MKKYLVIREYLDQNITPSVYAEIDDYESANKLAKEKNKGVQFVKYWVFEQSIGQKSINQQGASPAQNNKNMDTSKMVKVTLAKVRTKGQHYWDKGGTEYVCSGGAVDYSVDGTWYWNRRGKGQNTRVFIEK